jgi:hypothetical protein
VTHSTQPINELHLNTLGKLMFAGIAAWIVGKTVRLKIRGTHSQVEAITNAMLASRRFQDELKRPGATVQSVIDRLGLKQASAAEFERVLGVKWPF